MIKEAIDRILGLSIPNKIEYDNRVYVDKQMTALPKYRLPEPLGIHTLSAIVDYIKESTDISTHSNARYVIHVEDYDKVKLYTELNGDMERECLLSAGVSNCKYPFERFIDLESFIINLQANFVDTINLRNLISLAGNITSDTGVTQADDGITQRVTAKTGITIVGKVDVPNPIILAPYRTFTEIEQPESAFVFRLRKNGDSVNAALFEADGAAWKRNTIQIVSKWLSEQFSSKENERIVILA